MPLVNNYAPFGILHVANIESEPVIQSKSQVTSCETSSRFGQSDKSESVITFISMRPFLFHLIVQAAAENYSDEV